MINVHFSRQCACWLVAIVAIISFAHRLAAQSTAPRERLFLLTQENAYRFDTGLFSLDPSIKQHPCRLTGTEVSAMLGVRVWRSFAVTTKAFQSRTSGTGNWLDVGGLDAEDAVFLPVATGRTRLQIRGLVFGVRQTFRIGKVLPYVEGGAGVGRLKLSFNGMVQAIDPADGESFNVVASDVVRQLIPLGSAGAGVEVPVGPGVSLLSSYHWDMGSAFGVGIKYSLFRHSR